MKMKDYLIIFALFLTLMCCISTINAATDDAVNCTVSDVDFDYGDESLLGVDENDSFVVAQEINEQTPNDGVFDDLLLIDNDPGSFNDLAKEIEKIGSGGTLELTRNYVYTSGDSDIVIDKEIKINGNGFKIDACKSSRIFRCYGNEKVFNNIVFCNGFSDNNGGAIYSESKLTLNDCVFENNGILEDYCGIAIYSTSDVFLERCYFSNHKALDDAYFPYLIYSGSVSLKDSKFFDNNCGAIIYKSNLTAINSQFLNNRNTPIYSNSAKYTYIKNCTFIGNTAYASLDYSYYSAMGISSVFGTYSDITLEDCKFINNSAYGPTVSLTFLNGSINKCEFINNFGNGGTGLYSESSILNLKNSKFDSNRDRDTGGAIKCFQTQICIESSDFINNSAKEAGAIYWDCHNSSIISCNFINNAAENGGAISNFNLINNNIEKSSFINNSANNSKIICFNKYISLSPNSSYFISKISDNYFDNYETIYGGSFSFQDNLLTVTKEYKYISSNITVMIDGKTFKKVINDSVCSIDLSNISSGVYDAKIMVSYEYGPSPCEITMPLSIQSFIIQVNDLNKSYGDPERLEIDLKESGGPIINEKVNITINGVTYTRTTDSKGHISMAINLDAGVYDAIVNYHGVTKTSKITVNIIPTKTYLNVYKTSKNSLYINVTVENASDGDIFVFKITSWFDVKEYECILKNSKAELHLSDLRGSYVINATYMGNINHQISNNVSEYYISGLEILPSTIPLIKYYKGSELAKILFWDENNVPIYNTTADIYIDDVKYTNSTDINGYISIDVDLKSGYYIGWIDYDGERSPISIQIKPTVYGNDVTGNYNNVRYSANFVDSNGKALKNGTATFKINSKTYYSEISEGIASINVPESHGSYIVEVTNPVTGEKINTNNITILPAESAIHLANVKDIAGGDSVTVTANFNSNDGVVIFSINSTNKTVKMVNGKASCTFDDLYPGHYIVSATYIDPKGDYLSSSDFKSFNVSKFSQAISVIADDIGAGQNAIFQVSIKNDATGEICLIINNKTYKNQLHEGKAIFSVPNLGAGNYTYDIFYAGDDNYNPKNTSGNISVIIFNVFLNVSDLTKYYLSPDQLSVQLLDKSGNALSGQKIIFKLNDKDYEQTTNDLGIASINVDLNSGNYTAEIKFNGNKQYDSIKTIAQIEIKPTVFGSDVIADYNNVTYMANFVESNGKALKNGTATFKLNSKTYYSKISKGIASINVPESHGSYVVEVTNPLTGETNSNKITVLPAKTETKLSGVKNIDFGDSINITARVNASVGIIIFTINSINKTVNVVNNKASCTFGDLNVGSYMVNATYIDPEGNYLSSSVSKSFNVSKASPDISVIADDIGEGQNAVFQITLSDGATGLIDLIINNKLYYILYEGKTIFRIPNLGVGNYTYSISYAGNDKYNPKIISGNIRVYNTNLILNVSDLIKYYSSPDQLSAQLLDKSGNALSGQKIIFTLNDKDYERTTNDLGIASMNINLNSGNYIAEVKFNGNEIYDSIKTTVQIEIKPTVMAKDFSKIFRNDTQYYATLLDSQGNKLKNTTVELNINGVFYNRTTNENGIVRLNINLNPGEYILTAINPSTSEMHATTITVLSSIADANDLIKYYRNASQYTIKIIGSDGKTVGAGENVTFNINGVFYTRSTNASGIAKLNINLGPGDYIITAEYNGYRVSNNITVLTTLETEDMSMKYKDGSAFKVKVLDGQGKAYSNQTVQFNINGVLYNRVSGSDGIAKLNIRLMAGEYIITSSYNGYGIGNKITISS